MKYIFEFKRTKTVTERARIIVDAPSVAQARNRVDEGVTELLQYEVVSGHDFEEGPGRLTGMDARGLRNVPVIGHVKSEIEALT